MISYRKRNFMDFFVDSLYNHFYLLRKVDGKFSIARSSMSLIINTGDKLVILKILHKKPCTSLSYMRMAPASFCFPCCWAPGRHSSVGQKNACVHENPCQCELKANLHPMKLFKDLLAVFLPSTASERL